MVIECKDSSKQAVGHSVGRLLDIHYGGQLALAFLFIKSQSDPRRLRRTDQMHLTNTAFVRKRKDGLCALRELTS